MSQEEENQMPLEALNTTELLQILSNPNNGGHRLKAGLSQERLIYLIRTGENPLPAETAQTTDTRAQLEYWIRKVAWDGINSQLPCLGEDRGKCSIYPCSEGRHLACYLGAKKYL